MAPERGYIVAKGLLQEHFGNEYKIAAAYIGKALAWPTITKAEDIKALQAYALFLRGCANVMEELQYMQELDMPSNMKMVVFKLPYKLREQWRNKAHNIMEASNNRAHFIDLVKFIERHVRVLSDPIFGDIEDSGHKSVAIKSSNMFQPQSKNRMKGSSFAATVFPMSEVGIKTTNNSKPQESLVCHCCDHNTHVLDRCKQFSERKHRDKIQFLKEKGICFGCLCIGHINRDCKQRLICETCGRTVAGNDGCILSIIPVQVKSTKGSEIIQTYAFLDPGSTATFCSEDLMHRLNITGKITNFLLKTMGQKKVVPAYSLFGMEVSGLEENNFYPLPEVLTQKQMPVTKEHIATAADVKRWNHLSKVHIPSINANVDMLIGTNAPKILEPWEIVNSCGNGPYAIRTVLGLAINGPLHGSSNGSDVDMELSSVVVNRISISKLELMLSSQYNHDFNEKPSEEKEMSREDQQFMEIMNTSATLQDNRYSLKLPLKTPGVLLPNNFAVAKQRLLGLRKRFVSNPMLHKEYASVLNGVIEKGYAEQVPTQQHYGSGKLWYIPHHSVYHPRKGSLRVVFDCGATFKGTTLSDVLYQGPNLTSSLLGVFTRFRQEPVAFMGDIQAMFHQVKVTEEDRDFLCLLWWPEGDFTREIQEYRMTVHLFGAVSSPSCASYALRKTADDNKSDFSAETVEAVKRNFYVDDCLMGLGSEKAAIQMVEDLNALCKRGGFVLEKWISNSRAVVQTISEEQKAKELKDLDLDRDNLPLERALGLLWCVKSDSFKFKMEVKQQALTTC
ncbi:uncharacterized protein LOC117560379 [Gymnodraco acuticeps]|uniref:Uncharacterized protein LOC117560379 n=1 Tax=Gymnodraco acuticeps TaxID=8218 RepID=A0A6P8VQU3_GYMAC|nr:uncharacterized protein LOC117560379 [Gymnodraco acuticeps]